MKLHIFRRNAPAPTAPVTAEHIISVMTARLNAALRSYLDRMAAWRGETINAPRDLGERRALLALADRDFIEAQTIWNLAKEAGFADMIDLEPDLVSIMAIIINPLGAAGTAAA